MKILILIRNHNKSRYGLAYSYSDAFLSLGHSVLVEELAYEYSVVSKVARVVFRNVLLQMEFDKRHILVKVVTSNPKEVKDEPRKKKKIYTRAKSPNYKRSTQKSYLCI